MTLYVTIVTYLSKGYLEREVVMSKFTIAIFTIIFLSTFIAEPAQAGFWEGFARGAAERLNERLQEEDEDCMDTGNCY